MRRYERGHCHIRHVKTRGRASFLITLFQFLQYYVFVVLSGDAFFTGTFIATSSPEKKIAYKTFALITCDKIGKLLFVIFWKHLAQLFGHFNPLPLLLVSPNLLKVH